MENTISNSGALSSIVGKKITALTAADDQLLIVAEDGTQISLSDEGQSCCENRYMSVEVDLPYFIGATFLGADVARAPDGICEFGEHEVAFLHVKTSKGTITVSTHNEHNGYYGGFRLTATVVKGGPRDT